MSEHEEFKKLADILDQYMEKKGLALESKYLLTRYLSDEYFDEMKDLIKTNDDLNDFDEFEDDDDDEDLDDNDIDDAELIEPDDDLDQLEEDQKLLDKTITKSTNKIDNSDIEKDLDKIIKSDKKQVKK